MNLYRIHYGWSTGSASSGEIEYYEDESRFKVDLLDHHLDLQAHHDRRNWGKYMLNVLWRKSRGNDNKPRRTTNIFKVEKVVNDEWVPVEYEFIEPEVRIK